MRGHLNPRTAREVIDLCGAISRISEDAGRTTRTFLSPPTREVHRLLREWMERLRMQPWVDGAGNLRGVYTAAESDAPRLLIGSHIDTVPGAGAFDGVLGVVLALALVDALGGVRLGCDIEVVAFSEEEGVRFGVPFIGSRALAATLDSGLLARTDRNGVSISEAIRAYGLDPESIPSAQLGPRVLAYLEFHIEQGPVLEHLGLPIGVVEAIAGQSRLEVRLLGKANHAGTTPMHLRNDALAGAAEWIRSVEQEALRTEGLVATIGRIEARPGAANVIPGEVRASLDVRHARDDVRRGAVDRILDSARTIASRRGLSFEPELNLDQAAVPCDPWLIAAIERAVTAAGFPVHRMTSGAGHDAMILASRVPIAMLFLRSPGGISHHPDESVNEDDVAAALNVGLLVLQELDRGIETGAA